VTTPESTSDLRQPSLGAALAPVIVLVLALALAFFLYGGDATGGPIQVALILCALLSGLIGMRHGMPAKAVGQGAVDSITTAVGAIFILLSVGALIGTWGMSGTIATLTYYGLQFITPDWFLIAAVLLCAGMALAIGSSWTVAGTFGVALVGIGTALGVPAGLAAGAVISGAYFGDKLSPLSETTNLAPAVAGTDLYSHIRAMMSTTIPSILIALGIYLLLGITGDYAGELDLSTATDAIASVFTVGLVTLLPLVVVIVLALRKASPIIAIMAASLTAGLVAVFWQPDVVKAFVDEPDLATPLVMVKGVWSAMATGFVADTGIEGLDSLVSGGGMVSMLGTVFLILSALAFGGIMQATGQLGRLIRPLHQWATSDRKIMTAAGGTAIGINLIAADQYMAIVLTGSMYKKEFEARRISPQTLSRQIEDTATVTSPLIPWNSCGAYMSATLGVATIAYLPFAFFNWINPILSFIYAALGLRIGHVEDEADYETVPEKIEVYGIGQETEEIEKQI